MGGPLHRYGSAHGPRRASLQSLYSHWEGGMDGRGSPIQPPKARCGNISPSQRPWHDSLFGRGCLRPPHPAGTLPPLPDLFHSPPPRPASASRTQLPEELHSQGGVDEEEQHEEEAQVAHLWGQWVGLSRVRGGGTAGSRQRASLRVRAGSASVSATPRPTSWRAGWVQHRAQDNNITRVKPLLVAPIAQW